MKVLKSTVILTLLTFAVYGQAQQPWKTYYDSTQLYWSKDWVKTVSLLERAERSALADLGLYHENYLTILNDLGTAYWKAKDYSRAESILNRSLSLKAEVYPQRDKEVILSMSNLAGFYAEQGLWKKSRTLYNRILESDPADIPPDIYVGAAQNLVSLYDISQQHDSARLLLSRIEKWNLLPVDSYLAYQHKFYRARAQRKLQNYDAAHRDLKDVIAALEHRAEPDMKELFMQCLQEEGILFLQTGMYSQAEKKLLHAYELVAAESNRDLLLTELSNNLAQVYDKLNIHHKALQYYEESLGRCRQSYDDDSLPCVILTNNIAGIHLKQDDLPKAINVYEKVIRQFEKLLAPSDVLYITALNNVATAYRRNDQIALAKQYLEKAEKLLKDEGVGENDITATVLNNIAVINTVQGEYQRAAANYHKAFDIKRAIYGENSVLLMDLMSNLAVTYWALNDPDQAIPLFKRSMELAVRQVTYVFPNLNETEQVQFYEKLREDFERFNTIAIQWAHKDPELLDRMFQNRTIIKSLQFFADQRRTKIVEKKNDPSLNELMSKLRDGRDRLGHIYQLPLNDLQNAADISSLESEIDSLEKAISLRTSETLPDDDFTADKIGWRSLTDKLQDDEAIIEMVRFRKYDRQSSQKKDYFGFADSVHYAALILTRDTKDKPELVLLRDGNNLETRYFNYYRNAIKYGVEDELSFDLFWQPLGVKLGGKRRIFFSADGVYHKMNINTLREPRSGQFLLEKFDIIYLLNPLQFLENSKMPGPSKRQAVLMGDPVFNLDVNAAPDGALKSNDFADLPGTQGELRAIDQVLKTNSWKTRLFMKEEATEANLKSIVSPTILHLASHGFFSSDVVTLNTKAKKEFLFHSGLVLSGANQSLAAGSTSSRNDGIVTAFEVMNLDLSRTHLVVLSACETGLGKIENGEGVFGLQRSFMQAGARNVLISLWKVDDQATRDLMIRFYGYLSQGHSLHESLKKAQSDLAALTSDPALWGGFVLVGNN